MFSLCSLSSQLLLMGKSKHGCMIVWDPELTMMLLDIGAQQWHTVQMGQGEDRINSKGMVVRLLYTNSGFAVLALGSNAIHKLWKWVRNERNPSGKLMLRFILMDFLCFLAPISSSAAVFPVVIAAHPSEPNQIALGMSDGTVYVLEPSDADPKWGSAPPQENGARPSISNPASNSNQTSEPPPR
ncbi:hypothetical protein BHE74_00037544 [Ensete ventricosum]|nr:hypothetical protein GW17_00017897 [Ensete ventricosum]RWW55779.1 hypothetical protein BHE74_00037544 [Ensete ventricosum]RZR99027.1 hypothetical protein BHM03_00028495 [Ensete ventricosum]